MGPKSKLYNNQNKVRVWLALLLIFEDKTYLISSFFWLKRYNLLLSHLYMFSLLTTDKLGVLFISVVRIFTFLH